MGIKSSSADDPESPTTQREPAARTARAHSTVRFKIFFLLDNVYFNTNTAVIIIITCVTNSQVV